MYLKYSLAKSYVCASLQALHWQRPRSWACPCWHNPPKPRSASLGEDGRREGVVPSVLGCSSHTQTRPAACLEPRTTRLALGRRKARCGVGGARRKEWYARQAQDPVAFSCGVRAENWDRERKVPWLLRPLCAGQLDLPLAAVEFHLFCTGHHRLRSFHPGKLLYGSSPRRKTLLFLNSPLACWPLDLRPRDASGRSGP